MPSSASGTYSLPTLRFQNSKFSGGQSIHTVLSDMGAGIRTTRQHSGGGGGGVSSLTASVGDILSTALVAGDGMTLSANAAAHTVEMKISAVSTAMIPSFTACVRDAINSGLIAGNGITFSASGHSLEIKTATLTAGQILSFTGAVGLATNGVLVAGTAITLSFNATTQQMEIRASITSGGGIASFTACVGDAMFPNLKAGTNISYSFNAATHQTEINASGAGGVSSLTASVQQIVSTQTAIRYLDDYGAIGDGLNHPLSESFSTTASAIIYYPYMTSLTQEKDYLALLTALYDAPYGPYDTEDMVHIKAGYGEYMWGNDTFRPARCVHLEGVGAMEGNTGTLFVKNPGGHGIHLDNNAASGSRFEAFWMHCGGIPATAPRYSVGTIREYNPTTGYALLGPSDSSTTMTSSSTFEFRSILSLGDTATGKFYCTGVVNPFGNPASTLEINKDGNVFTPGETITWAGGSATICWIGRRARVLGITTRVGTNPNAGVVITGATSAQTATVTEYVPNNAPNYRAVTVLTGTLDADSVGLNDQDYEVFCRKGQFGHGILLNRRAYLDHVRVTPATGHGIYVSAGGGGYAGNANLTRIWRCLASNTGGSGIAVAGADANVVTVAECTTTENGGYGVFDNSFLGAVIYGNHISSGAIGSFYFGGGNSISFGNYTEGNQDRKPLKRKITRVLSGHMDMCGTTGTDTVTFAGGCRMTNSSIISSYMTAADTDWIIHGKGNSNGGADGVSKPALRIEKGGNRGSGVGVSVELALPWDQLLHRGEAKDLAYPGARFTVVENGGIGRTELRFMTLKAMGSNVVRSRAGDFKGIINVAGAGTISSVTVVSSGNTDSTFSDTLSISNPGAGVGAVLTPVIRRGLIEEVYVENGGSGYTNTFQLQTAMALRDDRLQLWCNTTGVATTTLMAVGVDANTDITIQPQGAGTVRVPHLRLAGVCNITSSTSLTASADLVLTPAGNGRVRFGTFTSTAVMTVTGYIEITDAGGVVRRLAVIG